MCAAMEMGPRVDSEKAVFQSSSDSEERLKPQALQGSLLTTLVPTWPRWVPGGAGFLGQKEGGGARGGQVLGGGSGRADLWTRAPAPLQAPRSRGETLAPLPGQ